MLVWSLSADGKVLTLQGTSDDHTTLPLGDKVSCDVVAQWVYQSQ
jgi:hypothetical protein